MTDPAKPQSTQEQNRFVIDQDSPHFARLSHPDEETELLLEQKVSELNHGMLMAPTCFSD